VLESIRETSFEKQLSYYSKKNSTKLVLAFDSTSSKEEDLQISFSSSKTLAGNTAAFLEEAGYSAKLTRNPKIGQLEKLLLQKDNVTKPHVLDIRIAAPILLCPFSRKHICEALVSTLSDSSVVDYAANEPESLAPIPRDLNLLAENLLKYKELPTVIPEVQVLRL